MSRDKYDWYTLDREIKQVQKDKKISEAKLGGLPTGFKESKLANYALVLAILISLLLSSFTFLLGALGVCFILFFIDIYRDYKSICKEREEYTFDEDDEEIIDPKEFCYQEYLYEQALQDKLDQDNNKYYETLERQRGLKVIEGGMDFSKEDEINLLVEMIENYFYCYKLPLLKLKNKEWDAFFDVLYETLEMHDLAQEAFSIISEVIRYTLANTLVNDKKEITLSDFLDGLDYLYGTNSYNGIVPDDISLDDIDKMKIAILGKSRK